VSNVTAGPRPLFAGVVQALLGGFDRLAARPYLILPPLALDLFLWLGPRLHIETLFRTLAASVQMPPAGTADLTTQVQMIREAITSVGASFNLFSALSTFPIGIPSLMASTMPTQTPIGMPRIVPLSDPSQVLLVWLGLTVIGLGLAAVYHRVLSASAAPGGAPARFLSLWLRVLAMAALTYLGIGVIIFASVVAASIVSLIIPFLVTGVAFLGFTLLFWLAVYLAFTPHGLVRYGLGLFRAMRESVDIVRTNFFSTVTFLTAAVLLSWLTGYVWDLPASDSWFEILAIVGHAFVSAMLLVASYIFYIGRREALLAKRQAPAAVESTSNGRDTRDA
jgi:hypothetical protein